MTEREARPSPEQLLKDAARADRGHLKVFLGAAPGVGKTYAMLRAAQRAKADGIDVCVGLIETHGRAETEAQLAGLERVPRRAIEHRGRSFDELDVDGILARRPQLVLVDEFAHSNVPGASHPKRHQDVRDLLDAGLDVWTTLNVQHLESLKDVVERITGVEVRETLPDEMLDRADEIELIDLPPEDLIRRLKEGRVYVPEQARQALAQFFGRGSLTALRELALRTAAEHIDAQLLEFKARHAVSEPWPTRERLLVCINEQDISQNVIRAARRIAEHRRIPWIAVHVQTPYALSLSDAARERIDRNLRLAQRLGADTSSLPGTDLVATLVDFARARNASQIVVGRPQPRAVRWPWTRSIATELVRRAAPLEITVVTWTAAEEARKGKALPTVPRPDLLSYAIAFGVCVVATMVASALDRFVGLLSVGVVFLLGVLFVAVRRGLGPALFASLISSVFYNFLFTEPRFTLTIQRADDLAAVISFFLASIIAGNLGGRLRQQLEALRNSARRSEEQAEFARTLTVAAQDRDVVRATVEHLASTLEVEAVFMQPGPDSRLIVLPGSGNQRPLEDVSHAAARWAWEHGEPAGSGTETLPASRWRFLVLGTARARIALLGVHVQQQGHELGADQSRLLQWVCDLAGLALERTQLASDLESSRVATETEGLRAALLSSVSHDLRTPLVSVIGAAEQLAHESNGRLGESARRELSAQILEEAERLNRFVQNLLDMTRLSYGRLAPRFEACDVNELLAGARKRVDRQRGRRELRIEVASDLPLVRADAILMEQVLVNLLDNAFKYSPPDAPVRVVGRREGPEVSIAVIDRGPGIPVADQEKVFDMFYRMKQSDSRSAGTGLGLAICRGMMAAHGGSIHVLPGLDGVGTRMELRLPAMDSA